MNKIQFELDADGKGVFFIEDNGSRQAEMVVSIDDRNITVFHTEVNPALKGQNLGTLLLDNMAGYARAHQKKVIALCSFVNAQFKKHPDKYGDIYDQHWH